MKVAELIEKLQSLNEPDLDVLAAEEAWWRPVGGPTVRQIKPDQYGNFHIGDDDTPDGVRIVTLG